MQHAAQYLPCGGPPQQCSNPPQVAALEHAAPCAALNEYKASIDWAKKMAARETTIRMVFILIWDLKKENKSGSGLVILPKTISFLGEQVITNLYGRPEIQVNKSVANIPPRACLCSL